MTGRFGVAMKRLLLLTLLALPVFADDLPATKLGEQADQQIRHALPVCSEEATVTTVGLQHKLPPNLLGNVVRMESKRPACAGQWVALTSTEGGFYIGMPWFLDGIEGATLEEKLKAFTWSAMKESWTAAVERTKTREGFFPVTIAETTERGKLPFKGLIDPTGSMFFFGSFTPLNSDIRTERVKALEPFLHLSPAQGAAAAPVTVIEFSDFECPSCQHAAGFLKLILTKYGDHVRYIRYDLPLVQMHPWALTAAIAGRAIYHQKPEVFWQYKEQIYANQENLTAFTIDQFARNFAKDHDLDMAKYDAEVGSDALREEVITGAGTALSNDVRATPTYMVNGTFVDPGTDGKALESYVAGLLKK